MAMAGGAAVLQVAGAGDGDEPRHSQGQGDSGGSFFSSSAAKAQAGAPGGDDRVTAAPTAATEAEERARKAAERAKARESRRETIVGSSARVESEVWRQSGSARASRKSPGRVGTEVEKRG